MRKQLIISAGAAGLVLGLGTAAYAASTPGSSGVIHQAGKPRQVTAGPAGLDVIVVTATGPPPGGNAGVTATCPASHPFVTGGGAQSASIANPLTLSAPVGLGGTGPGSWVASTVGNGQVTAYALCSK
jgi:hypothetical protein